MQFSPKLLRLVGTRIRINDGEDVHTDTSIDIFLGKNLDELVEK